MLGTRVEFSVPGSPQSRNGFSGKWVGPVSVTDQVHIPDTVKLTYLYENLTCFMVRYFFVITSDSIKNLV